jgi:putative ABC transport system ATP-binding protein
MFAGRVDPGPEAATRGSAGAPVVRAEGLSFAFGAGELRKQILFDLDLQIGTGEVVLLTGPSGSGKTTLLTLVGALRSVQEGRLEVLGEELNGASDDRLMRVRRRIGFIFQAHNLIEFLTARQNVEMVFNLHPEVTRAEACGRAAHLLETVGLADRADYHPSRLSGGQRQRVAIARALAGGPRLVLADEPTAALDGHTGRGVVDLLRSLAREQGCPVLMVTHDNRVLDIADRTVHMEDGRNVP